MTLSPQLAERLRAEIADHLVEIEDLFSRTVFVTCIVRVPGNPEGDVFVSSDPSIDELAAVLDRTRARSPIGGAASAPGEAMKD